MEFETLAREDQIATRDSTPGAEALRALERARDLPSVPAVAVEVLRIARDDEADAAELARVVSLDPALSAKVLRVANSALLGRACEIVTLKRACAQLGFKTVKLWALSFAMVDSLEHTRTEGFDYDEYWKRSVLRAVSAKLISEATDRRTADEAFITALLSELGQLVLAGCLPDDYKKLREKCGDDWPTLQTQREVLGYSSDDLGVALLSSWGLPEVIHQAVQWAQDPDNAKPDTSTLAQKLGQALRLAYGCQKLLCDAHRGRALADLRASAKSLLGLEPVQIEQILVKIDKHMAEMSEILQVNLKEPIDSTVVLREAQVEMLRETIFVLRDAVVNERRAAQLEAENSLLAIKAQSDPLTGLANQRTLQEAFRTIASPATEGHCGPRIGLLMIDIDDFKGVNDSYGHVVGDQVLRTVGETLRASTRGEDMAARYGGDEFAVLMLRTSAEGIEKAAARLHTEIAKQTVSTDKGPISISASIGFAHVEMFDKPIGPRELLELADSRMYAAKKALKSEAARGATDGSGLEQPLLAATEPGAARSPDGA